MKALLHLRRFSHVLLGISGTLWSAGTSAAPEVYVPPPDPRIETIETFFDSFRCPSPRYSAEYVKAADRWGIDYRLLPAISIVESTCGRFQRLNNHWGWNSANTGFASVSTGIDYVSRQLGRGAYYRGRDLDGKLSSYNPRLTYALAVKRLMGRMEPNPTTP